MEKSKIYSRVRFSADVLREASQRIMKFAETSGNRDTHRSMSIKVDDARWRHDSEDEFFADYRRSDGYATYDINCRPFSLEVIYNSYGQETTVDVSAPDRASIENVFDIFEARVGESRLPDPPPTLAPKPRVFIGHGQNLTWRDLKDHLTDKHGIEVEAYEVAARGGHAVRDVLEDMLDKSSLAMIVMTGDDMTGDGRKRARQNVVHEAGLFQGRLGFSRAIILLEDQVEEFSNIHGIDQVRFSTGNIKETFGEVLAIIRREFSGTGAD